MENMDKGLTVSKMSADKLSENTPNASKFICPSPKVWHFDEKKVSLCVRSPCKQGLCKNYIALN